MKTREKYIQKWHLYMFFLLLCSPYLFAQHSQPQPTPQLQPKHFVVLEDSEDLSSGTLLFREDFGGNSLYDPTVVAKGINGMSEDYIPITSLETCLRNCVGVLDMMAGRYLVTKKGYRNGGSANWSGWHIMDDHTYPDDYNRGYMVEIDGGYGELPYYKTTIKGLCANTKLSFSAYVVNVETASAFLGWHSANPKLSFVISDAKNGTQLARYDTDTIGHDWSLFNVASSWKYSAAWQQVGMTFVVPDEQDSVELTIYNNVYQATGNDFAMDDIEIFLKAPSPIITSPDTACIDTTYYFTIDFDDNDALGDRLEYRWIYSKDSLQWDTIADVRDLVIESPALADSGWYRIIIAGEGNIECPNCRVMSDPFYLHVVSCQKIIDLPDEPCFGTLLFREDFGGNSPDDPRISTTPLPQMETYQQLTSDRFGVMGGGRYLVTKSGYCNGDTAASNYVYRGSQWHIMDDHTYPNDYTRGYLLEVDGKAGDHIFYQTGIGNLCQSSVLTFSAYLANVVTYGQGHSSNFSLPNLTFVISDANTGTDLGTYNTGPVPYDTAKYNNPDLLGIWNPTYRNGQNQEWFVSARWLQYAYTIQIPDHVDSVLYTIRNNSTSTMGNDMAIDDIEIWLCTPDVDIVATDSACQDNSLTLNSSVTNNLSFVEPFDYRWDFSADSAQWTPVSSQATYTIEQPTETNAGWYRLTVASSGSINNSHCLTVSDPHKLTVVDCAPIYDTTYYIGCDSVQYRGQWYYKSRSRTFNFEREGMNGDSIHIDSLIVLHSSRGDISLNALDSIQFEDEWFYGDTVFYRHHTNQYDCDSLVTITMHFSYTTHYDTTYLTGCDSLLYDNRYYYHTTAITNTISHRHQGDSVHIDSLIVLPSSRSYINSNAVDSVKFEDEWFYGDTVFYRHHTNQYDCDSLVTITMHFSYTTHYDTTYLTGCDSVLYDNRYYYHTTAITNTVSHRHQGDSVHIDSLIVLPSSRSYINSNSVDSVKFEDEWFYGDTVFYRHHTNQYGCDSLVTITMHFSYTTHYDTTYLSGCDSVFYNNRWYYQSGKNTYTISQPYRGDRIHTDIYSVGYSSSYTYNLEGIDSLWFETMYLYQDTTMTWQLTNRAGCDSIVYFNIHITPSQDYTVDEGIEDLIVNKYDWIILLNNRRLHFLFPNSTVEDYTWLRNQEPQLYWHKLDYFTEDKLLNGTYQLLLTINGKTVRSNIITVSNPDDQPSPKRMKDGVLYIYYNDHEYNAQGIRIR